jgi:hypothetical protein
MAHEDAERSSEWAWVADSDLHLGCTLIFARDVTQDQMFEAFGLDPSSAQMERWGVPDHLVRVGQVGAWTFAIDPWGEASCHLIGENLSAGTEVVVILWTAKPNECFEYWADGTLVTRFETYRVCDRDGSDPDRFLREMRQAGMVIEADDPAEGPEDYVRATLDLATLALGIRLPEQVAMGPLATIELSPGLP